MFAHKLKTQKQVNVIGANVALGRVLPTETSTVTSLNPLFKIEFPDTQ